MSIKFADMAEERRSVMGCERSVITITLLRLDYLVHSLGNCAMTLSTVSDLSEEAVCILHPLRLGTASQYVN